MQELEVMFGMRNWKSVLAILAAVTLAACSGGGNDAGDSLFGNDNGSGTGGGTGGTIVEASDLSIVLSAKELDNAGTSTITATVVAVDAGRRALAGIPVDVSVNADAVATVTGSITDSDGKVVAQVGPGANRSNRTITVRAVSGDLTRSATFRVTGAKLQATAVPNIAQSGSASNEVQFRLVDRSGNPMPDEGITVNATGLPAQSGQTGPNGEFTYVYTAPTVAANTTVTITGDAAGDAESVEVLIQGSSGSTIPDVNPAVTPVVSASVSAAPNVVGVNTALPATNRAEIRALFQTNANAGIRNIRVRFDLFDDFSRNIGGTFLSADKIVYSDAQGAALTAYYPSTRSSPTNGVTVRACWDYKDFAVNTCPNQVLTNLTVTAEPVNVRISTNELIKSGRSNLTYIKEYLVSVTDAAGQPKADVTVTPSVDLLNYIKGPPWRWNGKAYLPRTTGNFPLVLDDPTLVPSYLACANEDANRNNVLDTGAGEDINTDGELWPRKADVLVSLVGEPKTDANGLAVVQIEYGRSLASWVQFRLTVTAGGISGTEGRDTYISVLPISGAAQSTEVPEPAWAVGPYGRNVTSCADRN
jgi:hypothetical protein